MKDFIERFGDELEELARARERETGGRHRARSRAYALAGALALVAVVAVVVFGGSSTQPALAGFPVLQRPVTDASRISIAPELRRHGAELTRARAFATALGRGYAIPTRGGGLCLAVPGGGGSFVKSCEDKRFIEEFGLRLVVVPLSRGSLNGQVLFTVLLPRGAAPPIASLATRRARILQIDRGVSSALVPRNASVSWAIRGRVTRVPMAHVGVASHVARGFCSGSRGHLRVVPQQGAGRTSCR